MIEDATLLYTEHFTVKELANLFITSKELAEIFIRSYMKRHRVGREQAEERLKQLGIELAHLPEK